MILMSEIKWAHDFVCAIGDPEVTCNMGSDYSRIGRRGALRGDKIIVSNVHRQITNPSESWSLEGVDYTPLEIHASVGNIIGCSLDERTGTIRCVERENTEAGRREITGEIEMWMKIEHGGS